MRSVEQLLADLTPIFRQVLENDTLVLSPQLAAREVDGWDSFSHVKLIAAIEEHYGIKFQLKQIVKFRNVGDMCQAIQQSAS
jgi:acyl carrier protein